MAQGRFRIKQQIFFFLERQFVKGAQYQLLFVAGLIGLISLIGGVLVWPTEGASSNLGESVWWAFLRLSDPGYLGDDEGTWKRFISTIITVLGYVVFLGSLVAIITTWMNRKIRNLEQGLTPIAANNHILILGWTNRTIHIAAELFLSVGRLRRFLKRYGVKKLNLIILADDVTPDRLQELKDHRMIGDRAHEIILRSGVAIDREHLRRVDSLNASAIIIPNQSYSGRELITPDVETIKTLLSLDAESNSLKDSDKPLVVAEIQDENKLRAANRAYSGPLEVVASDRIISRLVAQNIRHSGLSIVYNQLLSRKEKNNLFVKEYPELEGKTIEQLRKYFSIALVLGVVRPENDSYKPMLNLAPDFVMEKNDRLVLLAQKMNDIETYNKLADLPSKQEKRVGKGHLPIEDQSGVCKVLILGWNHHIPALIHELATYEDESYQITLASLRPIEDRIKQLNVYEDITSRIDCQHVFADYVKESELRRLAPETFDNIILASSDKLMDEEEADARTIVGYILLSGVLENATKQPQILLELSDPSNEILIKQFNSEVIIGPMILSHLLAQIALRRELHCIYNELFTVGGAEIIFRNPEEYQLKYGSIKFYELEDRSAEYNETLLGIYIQASEINKASLKINPGRNHQLEIGENVRLVVLTTIY